MLGLALAPHRRKRDLQQPAGEKVRVAVVLHAILDVRAAVVHELADAPVAGPAVVEFIQILGPCCWH